MKTTNLTKQALSKFKKSIDKSWEINSNNSSLKREFVEHSFMGGFVFVTKASIHAEVMKHYPKITLNENSVVVEFLVQKPGHLSALDFELAQRIDSLYALSTEKAKTSRRRF